MNMRYIIAMLVVLVTVEGEDEEGGGGAPDCSTLHDYNGQCKGWFEVGYCEEGSVFRHQARELCPSSCSGCGFRFQVEEDCLTLKDNFSTCRLWMLAGHCSYLGNHYGYMMEQCPYSCGGCVPALYTPDQECYKLTDYNPGCRDWAKKGLCEAKSHSVFMSSHCSYSCNGCLNELCAVAHDKSEYCSDYRRRGWCSPHNKYYQQIINDCQATCHGCADV